MSMSSYEHPLKDAVILGIELAEDKQAIKFLIKDEKFVIALADGDCCSHTWIEHIELPASGFPAQVSSIEDIELPGSDNNHPEHDCLQVYGLKISTDKGDIVIDFRNSSNGYYGGSLEWDADRHYGGVYGQNKSEEKWKPVLSEV